MIMANLATDRGMMAEITSADLLAVKWRGDDAATEFYHEWLEVEGRIEAEAMSSKSRMNMFWNQVRQSEKVSYALLQWKNLPREQQTYEYLLQLYREWLVDQKSYQNYLKALHKVDKPKVAALPKGPDGKAEAKKKGKQKKKSQEDPGNANGSVAAARDPKGSGKGRKPQKCLHFQEKYGAKGCKQPAGKCKYVHELCETQEEYNSLLERVTGGGSSSDSSAHRAPSSRRNAEAVREFRKKFCVYGSSCKFKDAGEKKCSKDHTKFPTREKWTAMLKQLGGDNEYGSPEEWPFK
jgi:hypothetical protein